MTIAIKSKLNPTSFDAIIDDISEQNSISKLNVSIEKLQPSGYFIASIYVEGWFNGLNGAEWSSGHHEKRYSDTLSGLNQLIGEIYE